MSGTVVIANNRAEGEPRYSLWPEDNTKLFETARLTWSMNIFFDAPVTTRRKSPEAIYPHMHVVQIYFPYASLLLFSRIAPRTQPSEKSRSRDNVSPRVNVHSGRQRVVYTVTYKNRYLYENSNTTKTSQQVMCLMWSFFFCLFIHYLFYYFQ